MAKSNLMVQTTTWKSKRRWTIVEARAAVLALESSGETVARFAARHGLDAQRVYGWRRRLSKAAEATSPGFVEVMRTARAPGGEGTFEVILATGAILRVPSQFEDEALRRLLSILRSERSC